MIKKLLMVAAVLVIGAAAPAAAQYPTVIVNPGTTVIGGTVTVSGQSCFPNETVQITLHPAGSSEVLLETTAVANEEGEFTTSFEIPAGTPDGMYDVEVTCGGTSTLVPIEVLSQNVTPPTTPGTTPGNNGGNGNNNGSNGSGELPRTGSDLNGFGLVGAGLLTAGGLFLIGARKRRSAAA